MEAHFTRLAGMARMKITPRDDEILCALSLKVRMFSLPQIARTWWTPTPPGETAAKRRLCVLEEAGLLACSRVLARPLPDLPGPLFSWNPGKPAPAFGPLAWKLQRRWTKPPARIAVFIATRRGANQFGGRSRGIIKQHFQATHDLGVSEMLLHRIRTAADEATDWVGEDVLRLTRRREKIPDAALSRDHGRTIYRILEFGGAYDTARIQRFHLDCSQRETPYELW
jgi:hypothetical protein